MLGSDMVATPKTPSVNLRQASSRGPGILPRLIAGKVLVVNSAGDVDFNDPAALVGSIALGGADPPAVSANLEGSSDHAARRDHTHAHGNQTSGVLHAAATSSVAGFHSATDKRDWDDRQNSDIVLGRRYGFVGDGIADDSDALIAAITDGLTRYGASFKLRALPGYNYRIKKTIDIDALSVAITGHVALGVVIGGEGGHGGSTFTLSGESTTMFPLVGGGTPTVPAVALTGATAKPVALRIKVVTTGARGTATVKVSTDNGAHYGSPIATSSSPVALSGAAAGAFLNFGVGTYGADHIWTAKHVILSFRSSNACGIENCSLVFPNADFSGVAIDLNHSTHIAADATAFRLSRVGAYGIDSSSLHTVVDTGFSVEHKFEHLHVTSAAFGIIGAGGPGRIEHMIARNVQGFPVYLGGGQNWRINGGTFEPIDDGAQAGVGKFLYSENCESLELNNCWTGDASVAGPWVQAWGTEGLKINSGVYIQSAGAPIEVHGGTGFVLDTAVVLAPYIVDFAAGGTCIGAQVRCPAYAGTTPYLNYNVVGLVEFTARGENVVIGRRAQWTPNITLAAGRNDNVGISSSSFGSSDPGGDYGISGFAVGGLIDDGYDIEFHQKWPHQFTAYHENANSTAAFRCINPTGQDLVFAAPPSGCTLVIKWRWLYDRQRCVFVGANVAPTSSVTSAMLAIDADVPYGNHALTGVKAVVYNGAVAHGAIGATQTWSLSAGPLHTGTLSTNATVTLTPPAGGVCGGTLKVTQDSTARTLAFTSGATVKWIGGSPIQPSAGSGDVNVYHWEYDGSVLTLAYLGVEA